MTDCFLTIVGGGVIGNAVANELSDLFRGEEIFLLDRNRRIPGENQSSRNSGVVHAGIYYDQTTCPLKARLSVEGNALLYRFCEENGLPYKKTGKLVVATNEEEDRSLDQLLSCAQKNNVPGIEKINGKKAQEHQLNVKAFSALWVPTSGIVDASGVVARLKFLAQRRNVSYIEATTVTAIQPQQEEFVITAERPGAGRFEFTTRYLINAAGLYSDEIARMVNPQFSHTIFPVRGEAMRFVQNDSRPELTVSMNVYPAPTFFVKPDGSRGQTVGVHLTPTFAADANGDYLRDQQGYVLGNVITVGPLATTQIRGNGMAKDDYKTDLRLPPEFFDKICRYFPGIRLEDLDYYQAGIQAFLTNHQDFVIETNQRYSRFVNLVGISSPGLTSSLAMGRYVRKLLEQ